MALQEGIFELPSAQEKMTENKPVELTARRLSIPHYIHKGSLVDPQLRASDAMYAPSKLARFLSRDGG